jgi:uncharacterized membrane protein YfcA
VNQPGKPSWEHLVWWLIAAVIGTQLLAAVLPRLLPSLAVVVALVVIVRIVWHFTNRY